METFEEMEAEPCVALVLPNAEITLVDADVYHEIAGLSWCKSGDYVARRLSGPRRGKQRREWLHRRVNRTPAGVATDHRNLFKMDNRRSNLRDASHSLNNGNRPKRQGNNQGASSSRFKGVYWHKRASKWHAAIKLGSKRVYLGIFTSEEAAARAYDAAALQHFGEFARLNFPAQ